MLSLLIRPLYGDDPSFGVRELMQNAVDAVREREYFQKQNSEYAKAKFRDQKADVVIWLSELHSKDKTAWLEVSDRGIGMTEKVLTNYFLTAGASYRRSEQWQQIFERSDLPPDKTKPRAQVLRTGRFGVGALAAFLIGEVMEVETRHITSSVGFRFTMFLTQEAVQVERVNDLPVGTRIRVRVSPAAYEKLCKNNYIVSRPGLWDWYILDKPSILRMWGKNKEVLKRAYRMSLNDWKPVETALPLTIHWSYDDKAPLLSCNGIFVSNTTKLPEIQDTHCGVEGQCVQTPQIHVTDPDGHLSLGLTRKEIVSEEYGFEADLASSIIKDFLAQVLVGFPEKPVPQEISAILDGVPFRRPGAYHWDKLLPDVLLASHGFRMPSPGVLSGKSLNFSRVLWAGAKYQRSRQLARWLVELEHNSCPWDCVVIVGGMTLPKLATGYGETRCSIIEALRADKRDEFEIAHYRYTNDETQEQSEDGSWSESNGSKERQPTERAQWIDWTKSGGGKVTKRCRTTWMIESLGMPASAHFKKILDDHKDAPDEIPFLAEFSLKRPRKEAFAPSILSNWWQKIFGDEWIPWKKADRHKKLPQAFSMLAPYIKHYE